MAEGPSTSKVTCRPLPNKPLTGIPLLEHYLATGDAPRSTGEGGLNLQGVLVRKPPKGSRSKLPKGETLPKKTAPTSQPTPPVIDTRPPLRVKLDPTPASGAEPKSSTITVRPDLRVTYGSSATTPQPHPRAVVLHPTTPLQPYTIPKKGAVEPRPPVFQPTRKRSLDRTSKAYFRAEIRRRKARSTTLRELIAEEEEEIRELRRLA